MKPDLLAVLKCFQKHNSMIVNNYKKDNDPNPYFMRSSESGEDAVFDIMNAVEKNGLPDHDRPEHVDRRFYQAAQTEAAASLRMGRPWDSARSPRKMSPLSLAATARSLRLGLDRHDPDRYAA